MHLSRSTACFAVRLLLSVAVVYRFFPAENKSIFAQRYGPCTPPDGTKHTNVRRVRTKHKTNVKDMHYPLVSCGFLPLAPLAEMRYTGNTETNVKENSLSQNLTVLPAPSGREPLAVVGSGLALSVTAYAVPHSPFCRCATSSPGAGEVFPQRERPWQSMQTLSLCQVISLLVQEALRFNRKLYRYAKGPILEGAVTVGDWGSLCVHPFRLAASRQATVPKGTALAVAGKFPA